MPVIRESPFVGVVCVVFDVIIGVFNWHFYAILALIIGIIYYLSLICQAFDYHVLSSSAFWRFYDALTPVFDILKYIYLTLLT